MARGTVDCVVPHIHSPARANARRLLAVLGLSIGILVIELVGGLASNSLALLADAGHVFTDVAGLSLALLAIWFGSRPTSSERTFGYLRLEILAAVANAVLLFAVAAFILYEAWRRLSDPPEVASGLMLAVAVVGLAGNGISLWLLHDVQRRSLTMRGAYLEVAGRRRRLRGGDRGRGCHRRDRSDRRRCVGVGRDRAADPAAHLGPAARRDRCPARSHTEGRRDGRCPPPHPRCAGVADVHDLHAWSITSGVNVVSAHVVLEPGAEPAGVLDFLCECLSGDFDIEHSTFQLESSDRRRLEAGSHG